MSSSLDYTLFNRLNLAQINVYSFSLTTISLKVINYSRSNHITLLIFPPNCSHELQPLDKSVYGPSRQVRLWPLQDKSVYGPFKTSQSTAPSRQVRLRPLQDKSVYAPSRQVRLRPLQDKSVYGPFKTSLSQTCQLLKIPNG